MTETEKSVRELPLSSNRMDPELRPIIIDYKKRKNKKRIARDEEGNERYTAGLKDIQILEGDVIRLAQKATNALAKGIDTYEQERQKSAKEKTDGAVEDFFYNSAKAASKYFKETSDIPLDLAESVNRTSYRKRLRKNLRRASRTIRMWRL
jgi:hypothetical protein